MINEWQLELMEAAAEKVGAETQYHIGYKFHLQSIERKL